MENELCYRDTSGETTTSRLTLVNRINDEFNATTLRRVTDLACLGWNAPVAAG